MPVRTEQQEYTAMCLFKEIYDKSLAVEVAVSGVLNKYDCEFQGTYILDNYKNPTSNEEPNVYPLDTKEPDSHINEVVIKHDKLQTSSSQPIYTLTNVFNQIQLIAPFDQGGHAYNTFYIVDDGTCKVCVFNLYFETKGQAISKQEIGRIPDAILPADGKSMGFPASVYRNAGGYINWLDMCYFGFNQYYKMLYCFLQNVQEVILESSTDIYKYCASGMYHLLDNDLII
ncbi:MAG: hypothetical protein EZS28_000019 [Streblomastix strix]|uniref:Uncharacterized protein n=1 Tax=Streblomastix strix TaxID=222440 RepID=A0A5J4XB21_9EUKA|nr:MAG: hypothetical protein EZS28_000019 [Streblomastix strix]